MSLALAAQNFYYRNKTGFVGFVFNETGLTQEFCGIIFTSGGQT